MHTAPCLLSPAAPVPPPPPAHQQPPDKSHHLGRQAVQPPAPETQHATAWLWSAHCQRHSHQGDEHATPAPPTTHLAVASALPAAASRRRTLRALPRRRLVPVGAARNARHTCLCTPTCVPQGSPLTPAAPKWMLYMPARPRADRTLPTHVVMPALGGCWVAAQQPAVSHTSRWGHALPNSRLRPPASQFCQRMDSRNAAERSKPHAAAYQQARKLRNNTQLSPWPLAQHSRMSDAAYTHHTRWA